MSNNMENVAPHVIKVVARQVQSLAQEKMEGINLLINDDDMTDIQAIIEGPPETPYQGGQFCVKLALSKDYPASPPKGNLETEFDESNSQLDCCRLLPDQDISPQCWTHRRDMCQHSEEGLEA